STGNFMNLETRTRLDGPGRQSRGFIQDAKAVTIRIDEEVDQDASTKFLVRACIRDDQHLVIVQYSREGEHPGCDLGCAEVRAVTRQRPKVQATITQRRPLVANR